MNYLFNIKVDRLGLRLRGKLEIVPQASEIVDSALSAHCTSSTTVPAHLRLQLLHWQCHCLSAIKHRLNDESPESLIKVPGLPTSAVHRQLEVRSALYAGSSSEK